MSTTILFDNSSYLDKKESLTDFDAGQCTLPLSYAVNLPWTLSQVNGAFVFCEGEMLD